MKKQHDHGNTYKGKHYLGMANSSEVLSFVIMGVGTEGRHCTDKSPSLSIWKLKDNPPPQFYTFSNKATPTPSRTNFNSATLYEPMMIIFIQTTTTKSLCCKVCNLIFCVGAKEEEVG